MKDPIIYQANNWEFVSECDAEGKSWIMPRNLTERWMEIAPRQRPMVADCGRCSSDEFMARGSGTVLDASSV